MTTATSAPAGPTARNTPPTVTADLVGRLGGLVTTGTAGTYATTEVFTGAPLATLPRTGVGDVATAVGAAAAAQPGWAELDVSARAAVIERFRELLLAHRDQVLDLIQAETGKARRDAFEEFCEPVLVAGYYRRTAPRLLRPARRAGSIPLAVRATELRRPKGVVGIIAPWNYPFALSIGDLLPALLAGNAVVLMPDRNTALSPLFGVELLQRAGLPDDVVRVVLGAGPEIGPAVVDGVDYVGFTGSTATGAQIAQRAGARLVGSSLELGGKNAMIVLGDADIDATVDIAVRGCFANAGQLCLSLERIYVHDSIIDRFAERFVARTAALRLAAGYDYTADMGSLTSARALATVTEHVDDARANGATVLTGGHPCPEIGRYFYAPTVLTDVTPEMLCHHNETFGPVVSLYPFHTDADAIARANDTSYGLNASVCGRDLVRAERVACALRAGTVNINDSYAAAFASTDAPMGGIGASGLGRRHGAEGLLKYTDAQVVANQRVPLSEPPRWMPKRWHPTVLTAVIRAMQKTGLR